MIFVPLVCQSENLLINGLAEGEGKVTKHVTADLAGYSNEEIMLYSNIICFQSGYDSRESGNYYRIAPSSFRLTRTNAGIAGRWVFHLNNPLTCNLFSSIVVIPPKMELFVNV